MSSIPKFGQNGLKITKSYQMSAKTYRIGTKYTKSYQNVPNYNVLYSPIRPKFTKYSSKDAKTGTNLRLVVVGRTYAKFNHTEN